MSWRPARTARGEFGSAEAQPGCRVAFQGAQAQFGQLVADLVDPGGVFAGKEAALGHE